MSENTFHRCLLSAILLFLAASPLSEQGIAAWPEKNDLAAAPPEFQLRGKMIADEIKQKGGFAVAGQIVEKNGQPMKKGTYMVLLDGEKTDRFENGWFITSRKNKEKSVKLAVMTFQHDPVEIPLEIEQGKVNFQQVFLDRTPKAKLATLKGRVIDERGRPAVNTRVKLYLSVYYDPTAGAETTTDARGNYSFSGMSPQQYHMVVLPHVYSSSQGGVYKSLACSRAEFRVRPGDDSIRLTTVSQDDGLTRQERDITVTRILLPRIVTIELVYQPDGSTNFAGNNVTRNMFAMSQEENQWNVMGEEKIRNWIVFNRDASADGDILMGLNKGKYAFMQGFGSSSGLYSLGKTDFNSVRRADPDKIQSEDVPCELNHVYVARARRTGGYAKFVVRSIEIVDPTR